jgi:hypothetical protein
MRSVFCWSAVVLLAATFAVADDAVASTGPESDLELTFVAVDATVRNGIQGDAQVDLGSVSANLGGNRAGTVVRWRVAIRLDSRSGAASSARLWVALASETSGCGVRVDGVPIAVAPQLVDPVHRIGTAIVHQIELIIPRDVPAGPLLNDLQWIAESN